MIRAIRDAGYQTANRGKLHLFWRHDVELLMSDPLIREFGFTDPLETTGKCSQGRLRASAYTCPSSLGRPIFTFTEPPLTPNWRTLLWFRPQSER